MERFDSEKFDRTLDAALREQGIADADRQRWEAYDTPAEIIQQAGEQLKDTLKTAVRFNALPAIDAEEVYFNFLRTHHLEVPDVPS